MSGFVREHSWSVIVSVLLHGLLVLGLVLAAFLNTHREPAGLQPLPIDAVVVDSQALHAAQKVNSDRAEQEIARARAEEAAKVEAAAAQAAADSQADDDAQAAAAKQAEAAAAATADAESKAAAATAAADAAKAAAQQQVIDAKKATQVQKAAEAQRRAAAAKASEAAEEAQRASLVAAAKKMQEAKLAAEAKEALEAKKAAEAKQAADARRAADARQAAEAKKAADDRARLDREAELRRQMADEEHRRALQSGPLRDQYIAALQARIQRAWIKPPSANAGIDCNVEVTQVPGGAVTGARVTQCNGDAAVRQSIENAVYRASPLPDPPDPALFERNFVFRFKPND